MVDALGWYLLVLYEIFNSTYDHTACTRQCAHNLFVAWISWSQTVSFIRKTRKKKKLICSCWVMFLMHLIKCIKCKLRWFQSQIKQKWLGIRYISGWICLISDLSVLIRQQAGQGQIKVFFRILLMLPIGKGGKVVARTQKYKCEGRGLGFHGPF